MRPAQIVIGVVLALALGGGGFAVGMTVAKESAGPAASASPSAAGRGQAAGGGVVRGAGGAFGQAVNGRILSVNDGSITVQVQQPGAQGASGAPSTQIVLIGGTTRVVRTTETDIKLADLKPSDQVTVIGQPDSSGAISAVAVVAGGNALQQILGGQGGAPRGSASPSPTR